MKLVVKREVREVREGRIWFRFKVTLEKEGQKMTFSFYTVRKGEEGKEFVWFYEERELQEVFKNLSQSEMFFIAKEVKEGYELREFFDFDLFVCRYEKQEIRKLTRLYIAWVKKVFRKLNKANDEKNLEGWLIKEFSKEFEI